METKSTGTGVRVTFPLTAKVASQMPKVASQMPKVASQMPKVASQMPKVASQMPKVDFQQDGNVASVLKVLTTTSTTTCALRPGLDRALWMGRSSQMYRRTMARPRLLFRLLTSLIAAADLETDDLRRIRQEPVFLSDCVTTHHGGTQANPNSFCSFCTNVMTEVVVVLVSLSLCAS